MRTPPFRLALSSFALVAALAAFACGGRLEGSPGGSQGQTGNTGDQSSADDQDGGSSQSANASSSSGGSGGGGSGGGSGGGKGTPFPVCPNPAPDVGWTCSTPNQGCAYVDYDNGTCVSFVCSDGHWISSTPAGC